MIRFGRQLVTGLGAGLLSSCAIASSQLPIEQFITSLDTAPIAAQVSLTTLQQLDEALIRPTALFPALPSFSLQTLSALYQFHQNCRGSLAGIPTAARQFEQALCHQTLLPQTWFLANPIHPLGGSYAWHYLKFHPESSADLQRFLHVRERPDALAGLGRLSDDNLEAVANGQHWILQNGILWQQHQQVWRSYVSSIWQPLARQAGLMLSSPGPDCELPLGAICVKSIESYEIWWQSVLALAILIAILALVISGWQRRRLQQQQQFILQMLTHELRTPIANLGNVVETFRHDFDTLPKSAQIGFGRLANGVQHMRQMANASRHYLSADGMHDKLEEPTTVLLSEWLAAMTVGYDGVWFSLQQDERIGLPLYWGSLCLSNLLDNACKYGQPPIRLRAVWRNGWLKLSVIDAGELPQYKLSLLRSSALSPSGMGLGLAITSRVAKRLKGKLHLVGPPTTFTLELPCASQ